jgi:hypothetical protein
MPRTAAKFQQADIARAIRAVQQVAMPMEVILETDGTIRLKPTKAERPEPATPQLEAPGEIVL